MSRAIKTLIILIIIGIIGYFSYTFIQDWHNSELETVRNEVREELKSPDETDIPQEKLIQAFGEPRQEAAREDSQASQEDVHRKIMAFFSYLDSQEYVSAYISEGGTFEQFQQAVRTLSANPPVISGETEALYTLYSNMSHFFRTLGKKKVYLIRDILRNEYEIIESVMDTFYAWFTATDGTGVGDRPSLKMLYDYSAYFLTTLSGRSYLLRRAPKIRILTTYYCALIVDKANDSLLNSMGIDIRPHIKTLINEISSQTGFIHKERYLSELTVLQEKYQL